MRHLELGAGVDGDRAVRINSRREALVIDLDRRARAPTPLLPPTNHIAIRPIWQARSKRRLPRATRVVDGDEPDRATTVRELVRAVGLHVRKPLRADGVEEGDHARDGCPAVLAFPVINERVCE